MGGRAQPAAVRAGRLCSGPGCAAQAPDGQPAAQCQVVWQAQCRALQVPGISMFPSGGLCCPHPMSVAAPADATPPHADEMSTLPARHAAEMHALAQQHPALSGPAPLTACRLAERLLLEQVVGLGLTPHTSAHPPAGWLSGCCWSRRWAWASRPTPPPRACMQRMCSATCSWWATTRLRTSGGPTRWVRVAVGLHAGASCPLAGLLLQPGCPARVCCGNLAARRLGRPGCLCWCAQACSRAPGPTARATLRTWWWMTAWLRCARACTERVAAGGTACDDAGPAAAHVRLGVDWLLGWACL
jgi:hypothetical protein